MNHADVLFRQRLLDLGNRCFYQNQYTYTDFLTLDQQSEVYEMEKELNFVTWELFGGTEDCERKILRFGSQKELAYDEPYPITLLEVKPLMAKFSDQLTHRDYLGSLMNLGIGREMIGDIIVGDKCAYLFCLNHMADYLCENLTRIKHTTVRCMVCESLPLEAAPEVKTEEPIVSSGRIDAVISKVYHLSRSQSIALFREKKIFVNGRLQENNSASLRDGDILSVRGHGKFIFQGILGETKKGNYKIKIARYI